MPLGCEVYMPLGFGVSDLAEGVLAVLSMDCSRCIGTDKWSLRMLGVTCCAF